jgi:translation initiation factor IF-2
MAKEKVYILAKEFKVSSEALVQMLRGMGIPVKSHMSTVDENLREEIKKKFETERAEIRKKYEKKKTMIAKVREDLMARSVKPPQAETPAAAAPMPPPTAPAETPPAAPPVQTAAPVVEQRPQRPYHSSARPYSSQTGGRSASPYSSQSSQSVYTPVQTPFTRDKPAIPGAGPAPSSAAGSDFGGKGGQGGGRRVKKKKGDKRRSQDRPEISEIELKANIKKTLAKIGAGATKKKYKKELREDVDVEVGDRKILNVSEFVTVSELANMMGENVSAVLAKCLELGMLVTINQRLDFESIELLSDEFGFTAQLMREYAADEEVEPEETDSRIEPRSPVVTVMGHVDHGKTSLLDYIRKTNVIAGEAGGITQHIAAYEVITKQGKVTFLDTPGHEAFTAMRARGSQITDVIVLVVAADSAVMPQTKEAIDHARAAGVPIVIAINKIDLSTANPDKIKAELAQYNVLVEEYGGQVSCVEISAKNGKGIDRLLEMLALETEILELKASPYGRARGVVVEAELDKGKGPIATVLVQHGTLKKGDPFITGIHSGRVRDLYNERGQSVDTAGPSQPVIVLGLSGTPQAGDSFKVVDDEKEAREISARRRLAQREREMRKIGAVSLDHLYEQIKAGAVQTINLVIKGDVDGSVEALAESLEKLSTKEIKVNVIHKSVGAVKETDIMLASASNALIIGFHLSPNTKIREMAKKEGVEIRTYRIIYQAVEEIEKAMEGMLAPEIRENMLGVVTIKQVFKISKLGLIAGCEVLSGTITRNAKARVIRDDVEIADTEIATLRRHQDEAREVHAGQECGISFKKFSEFKEGDRIEVYEEIEVARKLSS